MKKLWIFTGLLLFFATVGGWGQATSTYTWSGTTDTDWNTTTNWTLTGGSATLSSLPEFTSAVIIPSVTNNPVAVSTTVYSLTVNGGTLNLNTGVSFEASNGVTLSSGTLILNGATLNTNSFSQTGGTLTFSSGTLDATLAVPKTVAFTQAAAYAGTIKADVVTLNLATGGITLSNANNEIGSFSGSVQTGSSISLTNSVSLTIPSALTGTGGITINNGGSLLTINAPVSAGTSGAVNLTADGIDGNGAITGGVLTVGSTDDISLSTATHSVLTLNVVSAGGDLSFKNSGALTLQGMGLNLSGNNLSVETTTSLSVGSPITAGTVSLTSGTTLVLDAINATTVALQAGGAVSQTGIITAGTTLTLKGSGAAYNLSLANAVATVETAATNPASVIFNNSAAYNANAITAASGVTLSGGALTLNGSINTTNAAITINPAVTLGAAVTVSSGAGAGDITFASIINGYNSLSVDAGAGTTIFNGAVGTGTQLGTLTITGTAALGSNSLSAATITNNGILTLVGASQTITGAPTPMGGTVEFTGGGTTLAGLTSFTNLAISSSATYAISPSTNISVSGNLTNNGTLSGVGILTLNGAGAQSITSGGSTFGGLTVNKGGGTATLQDDLTVSGAVQVSAGILDVNSNNLTVGGNLTNSGTAANLVNVGLVTLNGTGAQNITSGGAAFGALTVNKGGGTATLQDNLTVSGAVNITGGILDVNSKDLTVGGNLTNSGAANLITVGLVTLNGAGTQNVTSGGSTFGSVAKSGSGTAELQDDLTVSGAVNITGGILDVNGKNLSVGGNLTNTATLSSVGTLLLTGTATPQSITSGGAAFGALTVSKTSGTATLADALVITGGALNISSGELDANGKGITINGGSWSRTGTFTSSSNTIYFNGTVTVNNTNAFNNVVCGGSTISFTGNNTFASLACSSTVSTAISFTGSQSIAALTANPSGAVTASLGGAAQWELTTLTAGNCTTSVNTTFTNCKSANFLDRRTTGSIQPAADGTGNIRVFAGGTFTWKDDAATTTDWNVDANWTGGWFPPVTDTLSVISIPAVTGANKTPVLNVATVACGTLTINSAIDVNSRTLNVNGVLTNNGTIRVQGTAANQVTASSYTPSGDTVIYENNSTAANWITLFGTAYNNLTIANTVTATGGMGSIASLTVSGAASIGANITTTGGGQTYTGLATLTNNVQFIAGTNTVSFNSGVIGSGGNRSITVGSDATTGATNASFSTPAVTNLSAITVWGTSTINTSVTTNGTQEYKDAVTLGADITFTGTGTVRFGSTVKSDAAGSYTLTVAGAKAQFNGDVGVSGSATTVTIKSVTTAAADITSAAAIYTTGDQSYGGPVTLSAAAGLISSGGEVGVTGVISGNYALTVKASQGIAIGSGSSRSTIQGALVTLNNTEGTTKTNNIAYYSNAGAGQTLQVSAKNDASGGTITINDNSGSITVAASGGGITTTGAGGNVTLTAAQAITVSDAVNAGGNVTLASGADSDITINSAGSISGLRLSLKTGTSTSGTGTVIINGTVSATYTGTDTEGEYTAAIYVWSKTINIGSGSTVVTPGTQSEACLYIDTAPTFGGAANITGNRFHIHTRNNAHIVYMDGTDPGNDSISDGAGSTLSNAASGREYLYIRSDNPTLPVNLVLRTAKNIYIIDVGTQNRTLNLAAAGFIEFRGTYQSNLSLTLSPGATGGIRLADGSTNPADITVPAFSTAGANLMLRGTTANTAKITTKTAAGITLGGTVNGQTANINSLELDTTSGLGTISVTGPVGAGVGGVPLNRITVNSNTTAANAVDFVGVVTASSYTQTGTGSTGFQSAQNYSGTNGSGNAFEFTGTTLTVNGTMGTSNADRLGPVKINSGTATFNGSVWAASYTQSAGNATFGGFQNYSGNFSFTGTALTVNNSMTVAGAVGVTVTNNGGAFSNGATGVISVTAGDFIQNGTGSSSIAANISTNASGKKIEFAMPVAITGPVIFTATNGPITLKGGTAADIVTSPTTGTHNLTLNAGTASGVITLGNSTGSNIVLGSPGTFTVTGSNVTTANNVPLNIGQSGTATNFTVSASTVVNPKGTLTVWGTTVNNGTITAAAPSSGNDSILFNGSYSGGTINGTGTNTHRIVFNGTSVAAGTFNHNNNILVLKGEYVPLGTRQNFAGTGTTLSANSVIRIEDRTASLINEVELTSGNVQQSGTSPTLTLARTNTISSPPLVGPKLYLGTNSWAIGNTTPPANTFAIYNGGLAFEEGSELHAANFYAAAKTALPGAYTVTFNGNASIYVSRNADINSEFDAAPSNELNLFTLVMDGTTPGTLTANSTPAAPTLPSAIGNLRIAGSGTKTIVTDIEIKGDVTIDNGAALDAGISVPPRRIHVTGYYNPALKADRGASWTQAGAFTFRDSTVEFGEQTNTPGVGRTFKISGNTTWWILACHEPLADILFSNHAAGSPPHTINHKFDVEPRDASGNLDGNIGPLSPNPHMILLSRIENGPIHPLTPIANGGAPYIPPSTPSDDFWYFDLAAGAELYFNHVYINYSFSRRRIPLPYGDPAKYLVLATPYYNMDPPPGNPNLGDPRSDPPATAAGGSFYNVNWFVANNFFYSFTEDSDGDGRIDRIRAQAAFELMKNTDVDPVTSSIYAFDRFDVQVDGYEIDTGQGYRGYDRVEETLTAPSGNAEDCIYIYLKPKPYSDTGARLSWRVVRNESLMDMTTKSIFIGEPSHGTLVADDTSPPVINYAFTLPEHPEIFFQLSEPVTVDPAAVSAPGSTTLETLNRVSPVQAEKEFLFTGITLQNLTALLTPPLFSIGGVRDEAVYVKDRRSDPDPSNRYPYQYPSPKYPVDWGYSDYREIRGWFDFNNPSDPGNKPFEEYVPGSTPSAATLPIRDWYDGTNGTTIEKGNLMYGAANGLTTATTDYGKGQHRITDLLISIPPTSLASGSPDHDRFFVWPLWAKYSGVGTDPGTDSLGSLPPGYGYMGPGSGSSSFNDNAIIWDFTGKRFLEREAQITMQARLSDNLGPASQLDLVSVFNVSEWYRSSAVHGSPGLWHSTAPFYNMVPFYTPVSLKSFASNPATRLYNYDLVNGVDYTGNGMLEFFFRSGGATPTPADLFAGRLDIVPGTAIPAAWYRLVRPFRFEIHDITRQRGGVTILNNVINSERRERVFLDYTLSSGGRVTIQVFTLDGNLVKILQRGSESAGNHRVSWDGTNNGGRPVARGMYFIRIVAPDIDEIRKVMVVK